MITFTKEQLIEIAQENVNTWAAAMETDNLAQKEYAAIRLRVAEIALSELARPKSQSIPVYYLNKFSGACVKLEWHPNAATDLAVYQPLYAEMPPPLVTSERAELENYRNAQQVVPGEAISRAVDGIMATYADSTDECRKLVRRHIEDACRAAMLQDKTEQPQNTQQNIPEIIHGGWVLVPIEPTEDMIIQGFESEPNESFSDEKEWEAYEAMSGCQQAAHRAKLCWAAMLAAAPQQCSDKSTKPVADLYAIKVPGCRALNYTTHAGEAESCASEGWLVQEYVKVERLQRPADNGGDSYALMDGLAFYSDKEEQQ